MRTVRQPYGNVQHLKKLASACGPSELYTTPLQPLRIINILPCDSHKTCTNRQHTAVRFPYALYDLTHKNVFPGFHPNDCPRNLDITSARKRRCNNAEYQDKFKHYREGHVCQIKHHWLWKMHFAFDRIRILAGFNGTLLRLDDDYYLADDVIHFIRKLDLYRKKSYSDCRMYILGDHEHFSEAPFRTAANGVLKASYYVGIGRGMAFTREFWEAFKKCSKSFCTHDEYNWDFALHRIAATCMRGGLRVMKPVASRVFHVGTCLGFHRKINNCRLETVKKNIQQLLHTVSANLFPDTISVIQANLAARPATQQYGGWADPRDHQLCLNIFHNVSDDEAILAQILNTLRHPANRSRL
ncbi:alpha-1,6-mannosyl-glycoprotein 2-beta-N-acetylglucosaminyltransferase-like [Gigantopelta aegis]|uniref:alpha-1,6-mannosyl-glycoprotein 2-beta-N-acetylglucosaminyltransferase-like n=1 Tax=Gigantopelta aegis TaxID=1735272 RepID=UPI001B88B590|nr:alpha-1,6-mannosyl-glycoprotein 2-beta-N-acetylglucosaminyltransferase-like [Gigantopelta aegis]